LLQESQLSRGCGPAETHLSRHSRRLADAKGKQRNDAPPRWIGQELDAVSIPFGHFALIVASGASHGLIWPAHKPLKLAIVPRTWNDGDAALAETAPRP
jgi:hypothetical protein